MMEPADDFNCWEKPEVECGLRDTCTKRDSHYCEHCTNNERNECADWYCPEVKEGER